MVAGFKERSSVLYGLLSKISNTRISIYVFENNFKYFALSNYLKDFF